MTWTTTVLRGAQVLLAALVLSGCVPSGQSQADEEKEPHYLAGKKRVNTLDYSGAIECFEKALEVNPRSGMAHLELACLLDRTNPAAAIYHYERYLELRPDADNARVVTQRITNCKQELALDVSLGPLTKRQELEYQQQVEQNKQLTDEVRRLKEQLHQWQDYAARLAAPTNRHWTAQPERPRASPDRPAPGAGAAAPLTTTYKVKAGENATVIARRYGIKVEALLAANPGLNPRRMQIGQALVIPVPPGPTTK